MTLNILENYDFSQIEHGSFDYYHLLIEALKKSFQHRNKVLTDPAFSHIPLDRLLDKRYAKQLAEEIGNVAAPAVSRSEATLLMPPSPMRKEMPFPLFRASISSSDLPLQRGDGHSAAKPRVIFRWTNPMSIHLNPASGRSTPSCRRW